MSVMKTIIQYLCCPQCKEEIVLEENKRFFCRSCKRRYPIVCGIPDFRLFPPPYDDIAYDVDTARRLARDYDTLDWENCLRLRMQIEKANKPKYPDDLLEAHMQFKLADKTKVPKILNLLDKAWERENAHESESKSPGIDIGCGTGAGVLAMSSRCDIVIGVDIMISDLLIARKLQESEQVSNFFLVCSCAEHLPFKSNTFSVVISRDVIEHVKNQESYLIEAVRVLKNERLFLFNSPNRFMLGLEPHVKLKKVGFLPRSLQPLYVKIRKNEIYRERLLSYFELTSMLKKLLLKYKLLNPECRIITTERSTSKLGKLTRVLPFLPSIINRYFYIFQHEHEMIVYKE